MPTSPPAARVASLLSSPENTSPSGVSTSAVSLFSPSATRTTPRVGIHPRECSASAWNQWPAASPPASDAALASASRGSSFVLFRFPVGLLFLLGLLLLGLLLLVVALALDAL